MTARIGVWVVVVGVWMTGSGVLTGVIVGRMLVARATGRFICRQVADVEAGLSLVTIVGFVAIGATLLGWVFGVSSFGGVLLGEIFGVFSPFRASSSYFVWRRWRFHRPHDVDCEYGHSRSPRSRARVAEWRKVAIRPAFGAT